MTIHDTNINQTGIALPPMFDSCAFQSLFHVPGSMMVQPQRKLGEAPRKKKQEISVWKTLQCGRGRGCLYVSKVFRNLPFYSKAKQKFYSYFLEPYSGNLELCFKKCEHDFKKFFLLVTK